MILTATKWGFGLLLLVLSAVAAKAEPPQKPDSDELRFRNLMLSLGEQEFVRNCAVCHGNDAHGGGPAASALRTPPADLTRIAERRGGEFPAGDIAAKIDGRFEVTAHGTREMPIWGVHLGHAIAEGATADEVARGRIDLLVEYLRTIQTVGAQRKP